MLDSSTEAIYEIPALLARGRAGHVRGAAKQKRADAASARTAKSPASAV